MGNSTKIINHPAMGFPIYRHPLMDFSPFFICWIPGDRQLSLAPVSAAGRIPIWPAAMKPLALCVVKGV